MSERWCKLYPHALTDPLWLAVADDAGTSPGLVGATFVQLLTWTSEHAPDTGSIAGFDPRVWAAWLRIKSEDVERIIASLRKFGRLAGDTIANWTKRQGAAAVAAIGAAARNISTPRTRKYRARQRAQLELLLPIPGTRSGVPGTPGAVPGNAESHVGNTPGNAKTPDISTSGTLGTAGTPEREGEGDREESCTTHSSGSESTRITYTLAEPEKPARPASAFFLKNNDGKEEAAGFEAFYAAYPLKAKRPRAVAAWRRARQIAEIVDIMSGLARYRRQKPEWQQWAQPASWLDDQRWTDEGTAGPVERDYIADYAKARHAGQLESPESDYPAPLMAKIKAREMEMFGSIAA